MATRPVAVIATGQSRFGASPKGIKGLFVEAMRDAMVAVAGTDDEGEAWMSDAATTLRGRVEEAWIGSLGFGGSQLGNAAALLCEHAGLARIPARRVENACASSGFAFRDAYQAVASGAVDIAVAGGVEKMNDLDGGHQRYWLGVSGDTEWERLAGLTFPGVYALMADRHMHEYGTTREHLAAVAVKNHAHGAQNEKAQFQKEVTKERVLAAPSVCAPLGLFDCCSTTDGASVAILASEEAAKEFTQSPVWVVGSGAASDHLAIHDRPSLTEIPATRAALQAALKGAQGAGLDVGPQDVDVAEVHDCFTIAELLAIEGLGFCPPGQGGPYTESGATDHGGEGPVVNPSGGLKAKGHPLGATGTAQVHEMFLQLSGRAGKRQVDDARLGLAHNVGGSGATCSVHLFSRRL